MWNSRFQIDLPTNSNPFSEYLSPRRGQSTNVGTKRRLNSYVARVPDGKSPLPIPLIDLLKTIFGMVCDFYYKENCKKMRLKPKFLYGSAFEHHIPPPPIP